MRECSGRTSGGGDYQVNGCSLMERGGGRGGGTALLQRSTTTTDDGEDEEEEWNTRCLCCCLLSKQRLRSVIPPFAPPPLVLLETSSNIFFYCGSAAPYWPETQSSIFVHSLLKPHDRARTLNRGACLITLITGTKRHGFSLKEKIFTPIPVTKNLQTLEGAHIKKTY